MPSKLKRQLSDDEKKQIIAQHGRKCWATGMMIPEDESLQFDHIHAFSRGGISNLDNIAPMTAECNRKKGTLSLEDFRVKLRLDRFFSAGDRLTLGDLLRHLSEQSDIAGYGADVDVTTDENKAKVVWMEGERSLEVYKCPTTEWNYFYATLPVSIIDSDDDKDQQVGLQPRYLIQKKVFEMFRHFQRHPVLQPSIGRLDGNKIRLFDGQHKIAGLLWAGRRDFECKIYLEPDLRLLNQTNIHAHYKFAQTRFYSSIMVMKIGSLFGADFSEYIDQDDGAIKSEANFLDWLDRREGSGVTRGALRARFRSFLYNAVIEHEDNKLKKFISATNRSTDQKPITIDLLSKSLFANFLGKNPRSDDIASESYKRDAERNNIVELLNMFYDLALNQWDHDAGKNDETQRPLRRMFRSKAAMAWSEILKGAICAKLDLNDEDDRQCPFYRDLEDTQLAQIKKVVQHLIAWKWWHAPEDDEIDRILSDKKSAVKIWLKEHGLTTGYLLGASE